MPVGFARIAELRRPTPHGVGGLKYADHVFGYTSPESHPSRGGWIEITHPT